MASLSMPPQLPSAKQDQSVKQEPQVKQEPIGQLPGLTQSYHAQPPFYQQQGSAYASSHQYGQQQQQQQSQPYNQASFSNLPSYNLSRHIMAMNMQQHNPVVSSAPTGIVSGTNSAAGSAAATPVMASAHLNPNGLSSAPSSPTPNNLQYHPGGGNSHFGSNANSNNNSGGNSPYPQHQSYPQQPYQGQHQHSYQHQTSHPSDLNSSGYYSSSPPYASQHQQQQSQGQQQQQGQHQQHGSSTPGANGAHVQFSSTAPSPMRQHQQQQYSPLVPPLSDSQYAQYHQLLGSSAFSSSQSTPYHSNHSTPYSSMPGSPTQEYHQLSGTQLSQKPKRRQVKNACVNCQKACKKCDEGRPCARCIKYGLTDTCVDSTRKVRKKGIKRGPYKRRHPPTQTGSASASTTPTMRSAVPSGVPGYMSEPVTTLSSPTQSHMLPFTSTAASTGTIGHMSSPLDFGYDTSGGPSGYSFHSQQQQPQQQRMESNYAPSYTAGYSGSNLYAPPYGMGNSTSSNNN